MKKRIVEQRITTGAYNFNREEIIIESAHGRLLISEGFGGGDLEGQQYRWRHGTVIKLMPEDTFDSLEAGNWNECTGLYQAVTQGHDDTRPMLEWSGYAIENFVKNAKMED